MMWLAEFTWDDIKHDKQKEYYLGNSLKANRPTFNCPKPNTGWWADKNATASTTTTTTTAAASAKDEILHHKQLEEDLMRQALYVVLWCIG
jgi:hypothetical protein